MKIRGGHRETLKKFNTLMKALGNNIITSEGNDVMGGSFILDHKVILDAQSAGETIFLCVYSAHFKTPPADNVPYGDVSPIGSHYIQIKNVKVNGNSITMDYWDYGGWTPNHTIRIDQLRNSTFGILTTK